MATKEKAPNYCWDKFDQEAENEGVARRVIRDALPSVMGKRISGSKHSYRATKVGSSHNNCLLRERKVGFEA
jgi:hypothetical protein